MAKIEVSGVDPTYKWNLPILEWLGMRFAVLPNVEGLLARALAALPVIGPYSPSSRKLPWGRRSQTG